MLICATRTLLFKNVVYYNMSLIILTVQSMYGTLAQLYNNTQDLGAELFSFACNQSM